AECCSALQEDERDGHREAGDRRHEDRFELRQADRELLVVGQSVRDAAAVESVPVCRALSTIAVTEIKAALRSGFRFLQSQRRGRDRLYVRTERQQTAVAVLHDKLPRVPWHVRKFTRELHAAGCVLGKKSVRIFDKEVCVEQFIVILVWIGCGR